MKIPYQCDLSRKKGAINVDSNLFPIPTLGGSDSPAISGTHVLVAHVTQFGDLVVRNPKHAHDIYHNGCFGSGALSLRSHNFSKLSKLITRRQFERRKEWLKLVPAGEVSDSISKVYVVDDGSQCSVDKDSLTKFNSSSGSKVFSGETSLEESKSSADISSGVPAAGSKTFSSNLYPGNESMSKVKSDAIPRSSILGPSSSAFTGISPPTSFERDPFPICEPLVLLAEETMFLCLLGCLAVSKTKYQQLEKISCASPDKIKVNAKQEEYMTIDELWKFLNARDNFFMYKFAVYYMLRSNKWVVKEGYNYGADYAIYPHPGPASYHSLHLVKINVYHMAAEPCLLRGSETLMDLNSGDRVAGNVKKDLNIALVHKPSSLTEPWSVWHCIENLRVEMMPCRRLELANLTVVKE